MLNEPTMEKLKALRLEAFAAAWVEQQKSATTGQLAFDERLGLLVDAEWLARENTRLARALREAKLKLSQACIEVIDYPARRELGSPRSDPRRRRASVSRSCEHHEPRRRGARAQHVGAVFGDNPARRARAVSSAFGRVR